MTIGLLQAVEEMGLKCPEDFDFDRFKSLFSKIEFPFHLNDSAAFVNWPSNELIDTYYVREFHLLDKYIDKDNPLNSIEDYKCSSIGRFETNSCVWSAPPSRPSLSARLVTTWIGWKGED